MSATKASLDLNQHFLIAMPGLQDPNFDHALIYICDYEPIGSMGLVVNQATDVSLGELLESMDLLSAATPEAIKAIPVFRGGPVHTEQGFVLHTPEKHWSATQVLSDQLCLSTSKDILHDIAEGQGPRQFLIILGYSGWGPEQLEEEIQDNAWLTAPALNKILFDTKIHLRWQQAVASLGFDPRLLSSDSGHA